MFIAQVVGTYTTYYWLAVITLVIISLFTLLAVTLKETPRWLMTQDRQYEARETLVWLRGPQYDVDKELKDTAQQLESENNANLSFLEKIKEFRKRSVLRPVIVAVILMFFQQCSGVTGS